MNEQQEKDKRSEMILEMIRGRKTARDEKARSAYYPYCFRQDTCAGAGASKKCQQCDFSFIVCETLTAYEETGLTPERIREIDRLYAEKCKETAAKWIPVEKRLPSKEEMQETYNNGVCGSEFIVMIEGAETPTALYRTLKGEWEDEIGESYNVIAWMPLPKPYIQQKVNQEFKKHIEDRFQKLE